MARYVKSLALNIFPLDVYKVVSSGLIRKGDPKEYVP
jgi:hypothetical protein